jgi:hypothetical protein
MTATDTIADGPQHMQALGRANEVRLARAELKRRVARGEVTAAEVVLTCPWEAEGMAVADLLTSQRQWGRNRCRKFLATVPLPETKTIGSMTERQRRAAAGMLMIATRRSNATRHVPAPDRVVEHVRRDERTPRHDDEEHVAQRRELREAALVAA